MKRKIALLALIMVMGQTACLKTRAQLKDDSEDSPRPAPAKVQDVQPQGQYVIDELKNEITRMTGRIEDLERSQKDASAGVPSKEEIKKLETRIVELEQAQAQLIDAWKKSQEAPAPRPAAEAVDLLEKGKTQIDNKEWEAAAETLTAYMKSPKAKVGLERASLYRGDAWFHLKQYKKAILDYSTITDKFPKSKVVPFALLRIGMCFEALGMKDDAKSFYQELVEKFPKTPEAKKARAKVK